MSRRVKLFSMSGWILAAGMLALAIDAHWNNYILKELNHLNEQSLKQEKAKSQALAIANYNIMHPESVTVDTSKGLLNFAVSYTHKSNNDLPANDKDTVAAAPVSKPAPTVETVTAPDSNNYFRGIIAYLTARIDSLNAAVSLYAMKLEQANQEQSIAKERSDSIAKVKPRDFSPPYFIGMRQSALSKPPKLQITLAAQAGYNWSNGSFTTGLGSNVYIGHTRIYNGIYYNWTKNPKPLTSDIRGNAAISQDLFNIYSRDKKPK